MTQHDLPTKDGNIVFTLRRSKKAKRTVTLTVDQTSQILVSAPIHTAFEKIEEFILKKSGWIKKKIQAHKLHEGFFVQKKYEHGANFLFLGKKSQLIVKESSQSKSSISYTDSGWIVDLISGLSSHQQQLQIKKQLNDWYRKQAQEFLAGRVFYFARLMNLEVKEVNVRTQKRIWGSCHNRTKRIFLNWQLMMAPIEVIDYVVIHELCHLWVPNHSKRFWAKVVKFKADYKDQKNWLRVNALDMILP